MKNETGKTRWWRLLALFAVFGLLAAACGSDDDDDSASEDATSTDSGTDDGDSDDGDSDDSSSDDDGDEDASGDEPAELLSIGGGSQPNATGFPLWLAQEEGLFAERGLDVTIEYFQSGAPMIEAGVSGDSWQVGWLGTPPALVAADAWDLILTGIEIAEGRNLGTYVRTEELGDQDPAEFLQGAEIMVPVNSTADWSLGECLTLLGLSRDDVSIIPLGPDDIDASFAAGQADAAAPFLRPGSPWVVDAESYTKVCDGEQAGISILDPWVVHPDFYASNPEESAAFVDAVHAANEWINANPDDAVTKMVEYYGTIGIDADETSAKADIADRIWYSLDDSIAAYESGEALAGFEAFADFFVSVGNWEEAPPIEPMIDRGLEVLLAAREYREARG